MLPKSLDGRQKVGTCLQSSKHMSHLPLSPLAFFNKITHRGIALFITLVILALLTLLMTEFSFETKLETRGIQNYQASFKARNAVKSMFKAVLEGLKGQDEIKFFREYIYNLLKLGTFGNEISFLNPPQPVRLPDGMIADFPDVSFYTPYIRPIDHLYNLNRIQTPPNRALNSETKSDVRLANQFINIVKKWSIPTNQQDVNTVSAQNVQININEILPIYAAIFDWMDKGSVNYDSSIYGTIGVEKDSYSAADPEIEIKDGYLDLLSEVQLIHGIREKRIPLDFWKKYFTIYPVGTKFDPTEDFSLIKPRINVNLATYEEIIEFLAQFDQNTNYFINYSQENYEDRYAQGFYEKREEIVEVQTKIPRSKLKNDDIKNKLRNITQYYSKSSDYFVVYSYWYEIYLKTEIDNVQAEVHAVVSVSRRKPDYSVEKLMIHDFLLR